MEGEQDRDTHDRSIKVFWAGGKVVSRTVTAKEIKKLSEVIKRKSVLWDNLHANDYDQKRVFLGPYTGRDMNPRSYLSGVMMNPNCEYSLNVPAIATLSQWVHNPAWDPSGLDAHNMALKEFLPTTTVAEYGQKPDKDAIAAALTEDDVDLICQMFWLPHSHGPLVNKLLKDLQYCKENELKAIFRRPLKTGWTVTAACATSSRLSATCATRRLTSPTETCCTT